MLGRLRLSVMWKPSKRLVVTTPAASPCYTYLQHRTFAKKAKKSKKVKVPKAATPEPDQIILSLTGVQKKLLSGRTLLEDISLSFFQGSKIGVCGANGSGKTSLLKIIGGVDDEFDGVRWSKDGLSIGYLQQEPVLDPTKDIRTNVTDGVLEDMAALERFDRVSLQMGEPEADIDALLEEQSKLLTQIEAKNLWDLPSSIDSAMTALRCPPGEDSVHALSGGEIRRVALCRLLISNPDVLLLDEPTNHLDASSVAWLEQYLKEYKGLVVSITHDRFFLDQVAGWILEIERGYARPFEGNYSGEIKKNIKTNIFSFFFFLVSCFLFLFSLVPSFSFLLLLNCLTDGENPFFFFLFFFFLPFCLLPNLTSIQFQHGWSRNKKDLMWVKKRRRYKRNVCQEN